MFQQLVQCLSVYSLGEVSSLMKTQLLFGWEQKAAGLQTQLDSLLTLIDKSITQIWESSPKEEGTTGMMAGVSGVKSSSLLIRKHFQK